MNMLVSSVGNSGSSTPLCTWLVWMSVELVEPPTLPPDTTTLASGLTTEISPLITLPHALTGVGSVLLTAKMLPLSGLGWPRRRLLGQPNPDKGSILAVNSTDPTPVRACGKVISGDISVVNPDANVVVSGGSVGGSTSPTDIQTNHVHKGVDDAEFPTIDTSMFLPYATNKYVPGKGTYSNIIIPPNTNPSFNAGTVLKGVIYIEQPNQVSFNGNASIQGVIVTDPDKQVGNLSTNTIKFTGSFSAQGVETLDASYGDLRNLSGSFMVMP